MTRKGIFSIIIGVIVLFSLIFGSKIFETNEKGFYQIKQAAVSGEMSARMTPGMYLQWFGDIQEWPKAATFFFTSEKDAADDDNSDGSIEVTFMDGSKCDISGTMRVLLPVAQDDAIRLVTKYGYRSYDDLEDKLILPVVRKALITTANLMTARESYSEKRTDFFAWAWNQIEHGIYKTEEVTKKVQDPISGEMVTRVFKVIKRDADGNALHEPSPLTGTGITLTNFEVKKFNYEDKVEKQIASQQEALMSVSTARAEAQKAEQDKIKIEAEGKAAVAKAQYEEEQKKIRSVVEAQRKLEVEVLARKEAEQTKQKEILLGQGEAARKRAVMVADGALKQKLDAYIEVQKVWADAFSKRNVPSTYFAGGTTGSGTDAEFKTFMQMMNVKNAQELSLDMRVSKNSGE